MKYIGIFLLYSTFSCPMDQNQKNNILNIPESIKPTTLAFASSELIAIGGEGGCALIHTNNSPTLIDQNDVFTLAVDKQDLLIVTNTQELFVYNVSKQQKIWENNTLETKNMSAQFAPDKKIIALDVKKNQIHIFDWKNNISKSYAVELVKPNWVKTPLLSCAQQNNNLLVGYIGNKQYPCVGTVAHDAINIKQFVSSQPSLYSQEALLNPTGEYVAIVDWIKGCTIWMPQTNKSYSFDGSNPSVVASLAFDCHKSYLALLDINGWALKFYKLETDKATLLKTITLTIQWPDQLNYSKRLDYSPNNKQVAVLGKNQIEVIDAFEDSSAD